MNECASEEFWAFLFIITRLFKIREKKKTEASSTKRYGVWSKKLTENKWLLKKSVNFAKSKVEKLQISPLTFHLSVPYMCPGIPSFDLPTPKFAGSSNLSPVPGSGPDTES